jgi:hypothetical protein
MDERENVVHLMLQCKNIQMSVVSSSCCLVVVGSPLQKKLLPSHDSWTVHKLSSNGTQAPCLPPFWLRYTVTPVTPTPIGDPSINH